MSETIYRQWLMLSKIPRHPRTITVTKLCEILNDEGQGIQKRTVQRDLNYLSRAFPLTCDNRGNTNYWCWMQDAPNQDLPGMDPATAITFKMAESYLTPLLPIATLNLLQPYFQQSRNVLANITENRLHNWPNKIATIDRGMVLQKPVINPDVQQVIYEALMHEKQIDALYRKRNADQPDHYRIHPLGIVSQQNFIYLVCAIKDRDNIRHLPLHRFESAEILETLDDAITIPEHFNLNAFINTEQHFQYALHPEPIQLKILLKKCAAIRLYETPIAEDQKLTEQKDGRTLLEATVAHTMTLNWWLQEFGSNVEVVEPVELREHFIEMVEELSEMYQVTELLA